MGLYLPLFPELCFHFTSCSSTFQAVPACGLVGLHLPTKELCLRNCLAHLPHCLPIFFMAGLEVLRCLQMLMRGREGGLLGLLQGSDPFWLSPFLEVRPTNSVFFLQHGACVLTWRAWLTSRRGLWRRVVQPVHPLRGRRASGVCSQCAS